MKINWIRLQTIITAILVIFCITILAVSNVSVNKKYEEAKHELEYFKNLNGQYIHQVDSIKSAINERDSVINKIISDYEDEKHNINNMDNNELILKFKELMWAE